MTDPSDFRAVSRAVRDAISSRTGYPAECLHPELSLDGDLGFDGAVYGNVVAALHRQFPNAPPPPAEPFRTIRELARWLYTGPPADAESPMISHLVFVPAPSGRVGVSGLVVGRTYSVADVNAVPGFTAAMFLGREPEGGMYRFGLEAGEVIALGAADVARVFRADDGRSNWIDPLTRLANRRAFGVAVAEAAHRAGADRTPLSVLALDLDGFRRINLTYLQTGGDRLLAEVAGFMRATLDGHLLARTGGDRFGVMLRGHDLPAALQVAERLRRAVEVWRWDAPDLGIRGESLTITIGAAALGSGAADADELRRAADDAFHRAEAAGRNRVSG